MDNILVLRNSGQNDKTVFVECQVCGRPEKRFAVGSKKFTCFTCKKERVRLYEREHRKKNGSKVLECQYCRHTVQRKLNWKKPMTCRECEVMVKCIYSTLVKYTTIK